MGQGTMGGRVGGRKVRAGRRRDRPVITLRDYEDLERLFAGKPELVLSYFAQAQIGCLMELALYERMMRERPPVAARIALVAATMGIREF